MITLVLAHFKNYVHLKKSQLIMDPANTEFAMIAKSALLPEECDSAQLTMVGQTE